jgi:hypothetical protein
MYELTKKKSTGYRIVMGIIVMIFISAVLKMAFLERPLNINDDLIKAANEINKHAPIIIDSTTRFDYVNALSGNVFQYNYTLMTMDKSQVDTFVLKSSGKESMIQNIKANPNAAIFKNNNIEIQSRYVDKNGAYITAISIYPNEY